MLEAIYRDKYLGKFLNNGGSWVKLVGVNVYDNTAPAYRHLDFALDSIGNQWWIKNELEPALAAGKILPEKELPEGAQVLSR